MSNANGGPAFPVIAANGLGHVSSGMSLRDYFAAHALTGIIATLESSEPVNDTIDTAETTGMYHAFALTAYRIADAMLTERAK